MYQHHSSTKSVIGLITQLDDYAAGCDPDFDTQFDDLEREFAELRLNFSNEA